ncbi:MAG: hypothetical protein IJC48_09955 [Clostridia bacterium]|nr:hypothetical protein [Clostridia bacterium]
MYKKLLSVFLTLALIMPLSFPKDAYASGIGDFGIEWMKTMSVGENENILISPASAYFALALAFMGAQGETRSEILKALHADEANAEDEARSIFLSLTDEEIEGTLSIASSVWTDGEYEIADAYAKAIQFNLDGESISMELSGIEAVNAVNGWVSEKTNGLINSLLNKPLDKDTLMLLINALYFEMDWQRRFLNVNTGKSAFTLDDGSETSAEYMRMTHYFKYLKLPGGEEIIRIPYEDECFAFYAIKPKTGESASECLENLEYQEIMRVNDAEESRIVLSIPKFEMESTLMFKPQLMEMGVVSAFSPDKAEFFNMLPDGDTPIYISDILQKTNIRVGEEGTRAAAATATLIDAASAPDMTEIIELSFDRSFVYLISDTKTNAVLFMGVLSNPDSAVFSQNSSLWSINDGAPGLTAEAGGKEYEIPSGSYELSSGDMGVIACGVHPLEMGEYPEIPAGDPREILLHCEVEPDYVTVRMWPYDAVHSEDIYNEPYEEASVYKNAVRVLGDGEYIIEVTCHYEKYADLSGTASYTFKAG